MVLVVSQTHYAITGLGTATSISTAVGTISHKMQNNILFWWLHNKGPFLLLKELGKSPELYRNCEACYYLGTKYFSDLLALAPRSEELLAKMTG
jgi:hypothetical protein